MNQPNRADRFVLPEGERKLSYERDTKVENAGTFVLQREDHTLGNVLRMCVWRESERKGDGVQRVGRGRVEPCVGGGGRSRARGEGEGGGARASEVRAEGSATRERGTRARTYD